ncbi:hypothetical protein [Bradyrhizobium sp. HKCCYLS20291]|uniref:hypothetical protein n=1 Tax=Bradyrhizobium sp. HKCCYLS20291 TaxID=3420766 RepID=UPI003EBB6EF2
MALHRDIFWIGRQWAVTAAGIQAIDQRLKGTFDIDRTRVWSDGLSKPLLGQPWFNAADFDKALSVARGRFPAEPEQPPPACPAASEDSATSPSSLELGTQGQLARFLPQWRIRN